jgi:16S rRNA (guanine527-N7)-methyltransferase
MIPENPPIWFHTICRKNGILIDDEQGQQISRYVSLLLEWNKKINLISRKDEENVWSSHILHSVSILFAVRFVDNPAILDLGSGGGLPGIPLKILLPRSTFRLIDSTQKKITAVQDMVNRLGLRGIETSWGRADELSKQSNLSSHFDYIVARAVAPLDDLVCWSTSFLRDVGRERSAVTASPVLLPPALVALKGGDIQAEIVKTERMKEVRSVNVTDLVFVGSEELPSTDKKVVVVKF